MYLMNIKYFNSTFVSISSPLKKIINGCVYRAHSRSVKESTILNPASYASIHTYYMVPLTVLVYVQSCHITKSNTSARWSCSVMKYFSLLPVYFFKQYVQSVKKLTLKRYWKVIKYWKVKVNMNIKVQIKHSLYNM